MRLKLETTPAMLMKSTKAHALHGAHFAASHAATCPDGSQWHGRNGGPCAGQLESVLVYSRLPAPVAWACAEPLAATCIARPPPQELRTPRGWVHLVGLQDSAGSVVPYEGVESNALRPSRLLMTVQPRRLSGTLVTFISWPAQALALTDSSSSHSYQPDRWPA